MTEHDPHAFIRRAAARPARYLLVPGLNDSGPDHWQSRWQTSRDDCVRVDLGDWSSPTRAGWVEQLAEAIVETDGPLVLVGHSLGCLAVLWWAAEASRAMTAKVAGAMLVAPPDVGQQGCDLRLLRFAPIPPCRLSFPALVVASENDPYSSLARSRALANSLGASFANVGRLGHINAASHLGDWADGQTLLAALTVDAVRDDGAD